MAGGRWWMLAAAGLVTIMSPVRPAHARAVRPAILDVPYLAQSELLCGGAAVAMVERWWGRRGVYGEDFASLVRPSEGGIRTTDLVAAVAARGWHARVVLGSEESVRRALDDSIPVIALVTAAGTRNHYVVIVGWSDDEVVYHDPAIAPDLTTTPARFSRRWTGTGNWAMLLTPGPAPTVEPPAPISPGPSLPCQPWTGRAATAARRGDLPDADRWLDQADSACPDLPLLRRERAGLRFREQRYAIAAELAAEYLAAVPDDSLAWQLLASARYLSGDHRAALAAWNRIGRPTVDLVAIGGVHRIRYPRLASAIGIDPGTVLTSRALVMAGRRLSDVPALAASRVDVRAVPDGLVEVEAHVLERPVMPRLEQLFLHNAATAVARAEVGGAVHSPTGNGESWHARYRWEDADHVGEIGLEVPLRLGLPAIVMVRGRRERERFDNGSEVQRTSTGIAARAWLNPVVEGMLETRLNDWQDGQRTLAFAIGTGIHLDDDRFALLARAERSAAIGDGAGFGRLGALGAWQSSGVVTLSVRAGIDWASRQTPRSLLPLAGGTLDRAIPLRAHRRVTDGLLTTVRQGTAMLHGGVAADRRVASVGLFDVGAGVFLDAARRTDTGTPARHWFDAGVGITIGIAGTDERFRLDLARGLSDQTGWVVTAGLSRPWPPRLGDRW